ncbi:MAG: hypothetical protein R3325_02400 [Thermoanaerobaculia bacterium]|nr:hypothetical protein [Thermoanaerobaculia bacterium]
MILPPPSRFRRAALAAAGLALAVAAAPAEIVEVPGLGRLDFPNSGAPEAQIDFARGVLLLHSFEFEDAREAFQRARQIDPSFALAAWGEAMTHNHPLWREQDRDAARAALASLPEDAPATERERGYLAALDALYGEGDRGERNLAYELAMERLAARYPDDLEARAFYSLAILGTADGRRDFGTYMRAAAVAEEVFAANPRHPGAAHYLIHSYDDPVHAPLGLRAARVYADIAPAASHAQHMISHIYVALGRWEDSVESNRNAFEVSRERAERKGLGADAFNFHALHWLQYSYLQLGRIDDAAELLESMAGWASEARSGRSRWYQAAMRATWAAETGQTPPVPPVEEVESAEAEIFDAFATGYPAAAAGDAETARAALDRIGSRIAELEASDETRGEELTRARVVAASLEAMLERGADRDAEALTRLGEAAAAEGALPLEYGPPRIPKPAHELLGEVLLALDRPSEARAQFERALSRAPRRSLSLAGLARAARDLGDDETADRACAELASIRGAAAGGGGSHPACGT